MTAPTPLPCCLDVPDPFLPKAEYATRMLLLPLGLDPRWIERSQLRGPALYYGPYTGVIPKGVLVIPHLESTAAYFEGSGAYDPSAARWLTWQGERWPILFGSDTVEDADLIASAFFWLAGWQEVTSPARDEHGRFPYEASLQARWSTATRPAVDAYRAMLGERLSALGLPVQPRPWGEHTWAFCPTHDVDYLRKWRPGMLWREVGPYFFGNARGEAFGDRLRRLGQVAREAFGRVDVFRYALERMREEEVARGATATYFFKTAARDPHDVGYRLHGAYGRSQVEALAEAGFEIGLHPSYLAHDHADYLRDERDRLAALLEAPPTSVRQHYLRYDLRTTPRLHADFGFAIDSTLAFAKHEGFRRGTCLPFQLFDTEANAPLDLLEMPLSVMDGTLFTHRALSQEEANAVTNEIMATCRRFGGVCVALWHNVLWDERDYPDWGQHFLDTLDAAQQHSAYLASLSDALEAWVGA